MAAMQYQLAPETPEDLGDPVTYREAVLLFDKTGHKVSVTTLRRYAREDRLDTVTEGRTVHVSWSDLLRSHGERTAAKLRASSNWP